MAKSSKPKDMEGEVFYPSEDVVSQARLKDWDMMAEKARNDLQGFWAAKRKSLNGSRSGTRYSTIQKSRFSNGS